MDTVRDEEAVVPVEPMDFLIVSGLPRSGTSLMMQMLVAGGLEPMRDDLRPADADNPLGYFEWEEIKKLPKNPRLIEKAHGKVTKVISMLLPSLPRGHRFRVIFMGRPIDEVISSQERMRHRRDTLTPATPREEMAAELRAPRTDAWPVARQPKHRGARNLVFRVTQRSADLGGTSSRVCPR